MMNCFLKSKLFTVIVVFLVIQAHVRAQSSPEVQLSELYRRGAGVSRRVSSFNSTGANWDCLMVEPGRTITLAELKGSGILRRQWFTMASSDPMYLRTNVIRYFWDSEQDPSVNIPFGDLFGMGHGVVTDFFSAPITVFRGSTKTPPGRGGFNLYFPMPFSTGARIEFENQSTTTTQLYYQIDYEQFESPINEPFRFHALWRMEKLVPPPGVRVPGRGATDRQSWNENINTTDTHNYMVLDAAGEGHLAGCVLSIDCRKGDPTKWWEGDEMMFIDDEPYPPSIHGTGTEDYFGFAYGLRGVAMQPQIGISFLDRSRPGLDEQYYQGRYTAYRFHIADPVRFRKRLRFSFEHGHANDAQVRFASTAYWYQSEPHKTQPALPPAAQRQWTDYPAEELVGYWNFNEGQGAVAHDRSGGGHDGQITGAAWKPGKKGGGLKFDGVSRVDIKNHPALEIEGDITIAAWIWKDAPNEAKRWDAIVSKSPRKWDYELLTSKDKSDQPAFYSKACKPDEVYGEKPVPSGSWQHLALTRRSDQAAFYMNGKLVNRTRMAGRFPKTGGALQIGFDGAAKGGNGMKGLIDEVFLYDRALSEDEILNLM